MNYRGISWDCYAKTDSDYFTIRSERKVAIIFDLYEGSLFMISYVRDAILKVIYRSVYLYLPQLFFAYIVFLSEIRISIKPELAILNDPNHIRSLQQRIALYEDMQAYHTLYNLFFHNLHRFCFSFVKSSEAAEEIVSDVFIKLWQIRNKLPEIDNLKVYLYQIAKNFCLNYITRHFKNPVASLDEIDLETVISLDNPEEMCISAEIINTIHQTIKQLPPQCRLIFQMVKEDGMRYKEVAEILQLSVLTVRNQVAIAVRKVADALPASIGLQYNLKGTK